MQQGSSNTLWDLNLDSASLILLGSGSDNIHDIDLYVREQYQRGRSLGFIVGSDTDADAIPLIFLDTERLKSYRIDYRNFSSNGAGFVIVIIVDNKM